MIYTLTVQRPHDPSPTTWLFDDAFEACQAQQLAETAQILLTHGQDYITDSHEFAAWVHGDG